MHTASIMASSWWPPWLRSSIFFLFTYSFSLPPHLLMSPHLNVCFPARARLKLHCTMQTDVKMPAAKSKVSGSEEADGCFLSISSTLWAFKYSNEAQQWHLKRWSAFLQAWIPLEELINWGVWPALFWRVFWRRWAQGERTGYRRSRLPVWDPQGQTESW